MKTHELRSVSLDQLGLARGEARLMSFSSCASAVANLSD
jgi:hypothetical protein